MSESSPIKDALYSEIDRIGQTQIHKLLLKNRFSDIFKEIFEKATIKIDQDISVEEKYGTLAESMTHYLFTEMLIPSQRKISYENMELDLIIPNTLELKKSSENTIIVFFVKTSNTDEIQNRISEIKTIQENNDNIWIISKYSMDIPHRIYLTTSTSFAKFLEDVQNFIHSKKMNKLNIFKTKMG